MNLQQNTQQKIPSIIPDRKKQERYELIEWLRDPVSFDLDSIFRDPGYSWKYKQMYNLMDPDHIIYTDTITEKDIDLELNIGYTEYTYDEIMDKDPLDKELEEFIDSIPKHVNSSVIETMTNNVTPDAKEYINTIEKRHNIVIPPGSYQSNANYVYKLIKLNNTKKYNIPSVSADPNARFKGDHINTNIILDKEQLYQFIYMNS
jgi:hypothetical protein